jgi:hypothetical protein
MKKRDFFRRFLAKDREEQGRSNPLFPVQKKPLWKKLLPVGGVLIILFFVCYGLHYFATQEKFYIRNVAFTGIYSLSQTEVESTTNTFLDSHAFLFFPKRHIWFFHSDKLKAVLENAFPLDVETVERTEQSLAITVTEDIVMVALHTGERWYLLSLDGHIVRPLTPEEIPLLAAPAADGTAPTIPFDRLPKIELKTTSSSLENNAAVLPKERLTALLTINTKLHAMGLTPKTFSFRNDDETWTTLTINEKNYSIYLDLAKDLDEQIFMLKTVMDKYTGKDENVSYIDVRFGNHVYVK